MFKIRNSSCSWIFLLGTMAALVLDIITGIFMRNANAISQNGRKFAGELQVLGISSPSLATEFDNDHYNITSNSAWASLIPSNKGIITAGVQGGKVQVALYQQLDCLNNIRISLLHLYNVSTTVPEIQPDFEKTENCFGIIRQLLLCAADITLETQGPPIHHADGSVEMGIINGLGVSHRCMDWEKVWSTVNKFQGSKLSFGSI
ncbi:hypothetical protein CPB84DRAFT_158242 [Gymnopilus junonius]|uniref:Uncharacterized protein n=1 Tax=Gymnopilus junonius TaxID=109634 RepID=A0A9P5NDQ7_GYMJU|nr:hypothetical protein CPB84DRAFT_158242 [Gymnopilus junonius]